MAFIRINVMTKQLRTRLNYRRYYERHADRVHKRHRRWAKTHPEKMRKFWRDWHAANLANDRQTARLWRSANPDKVKAKNHRQRARRNNNGDSWTAAEWDTLKQQLDFRCVGCWKTESELKTLGRKLVPDHIVPLFKGGLNHITNIQPLCHGVGGCNNSKGATYYDYLVA